jgi:hypothetical protein
LVNGVPHGDDGVLAHVNSPPNPAPQTSEWYYSGEFRNGTFHGQGRLYINGSLTRSGEFANGSFVPADNHGQGELEIHGAIALLMFFGFPILIFVVIAASLIMKARACESELGGGFGVHNAYNVHGTYNAYSHTPVYTAVVCSVCYTHVNIQAGQQAVCQYCGNTVGGPHVQQVMQPYSGGSL